MASPGILVDRVAELSGIPKPTVSQIDRILAAANLRSMGGRGLSAAKVTPRDAAHLVVALIGCDRPMDVEKAVQRYGLAQVAEDASMGALDAEGLAAVGALSPDHNFVDMVEALIIDASTGALHRKLVRYSHDPKGILAPLRLPGPDFELFAETPFTVGRLRVYGHGSCEVVYGLPQLRSVTTTNIREVVAQVEAIEGRGDRADLRQMRWVSSETIYGLAELFNDGSDAEVANA